MTSSCQSAAWSTGSKVSRTRSVPASARRIRSATTLVLGREVEWVPGITTGFTDSRFTRPLGTVTYGFTGGHPDDDPLLNRVHGTDESVGVKSLISGTKIMLALAYDMLAAR